MDATEAVDREVTTVLTKFKAAEGTAETSIQDLIEYLDQAKQELSDVCSVNTVASDDQEISLAQMLTLTRTCQKVKDTVSELATSHKDLHSSVSKVGKAIDRNFVSDLGLVINESLSNEEKVDVINRVICEHFLRQGMLDTADQLIQETGMQVEDKDREPFLELHRILEALKAKNAEPALWWSSVNRDQLLAKGSCLEFKLHRLKFIGLLRRGPNHQLEALAYARQFAPFAVQHSKDLQVLMGSLLYVRHGLEQSPYHSLLEPHLWDEICDVFTRDACALLGLSVESPLSVSIKAGCAALPPLLNIKQVMQKRQCSNIWTTRDELPVEIDLGPDLRYHSTFACPILRQQSTDSNPPVRLLCGHVISRDALNKLANGNKFKCPYCPVEQTVQDAKQIYF